MRSLYYTLQIWLTSILGGTLLSVLIAMFAGEKGMKIGEYFELYAVFSIICSLPTLLIVSISAYLLNKSNIGIYLKKIIIAIILTILISGTCYFLFHAIDYGIVKLIFPFWFAAIVGIIFFKLKIPETSKSKMQL